ncbi:MAG: fumarylacetoacetate hydrolase family protein [Janthinobacterium lividum]
MKIICIGRNYADHIAELHNETPAAPVIFLKPETALVQRSQPFFYPDFSTDVHYELELVLRISKNGRHIDAAFAHTYFDAIGLGLDFTARDLQNDLKKKGLPWELAKAFDGSAPISPTFRPVAEFTDLASINFRLEVNGETRQTGNSGLMLHPFAQIISFVSRYITLKQGDLLFTGTPAGVGPVQVGDQLVGFLEGEKLLEVAVK